MKKLYLLISIILWSAAVKAQYWQPVPSGTSKRLISVSFGSNMVGYIAGVDSLLLKTNDGGATWQPVAHSGLGFSMAARDIIDVNFLTEDIGYAIVSSYEDPQYMGVLHKTTNGGLSWTAVTSGSIAAWSTFFFNENNGYQVGSAFFAGQTLIELDNGTWQPERNFTFDNTQFLYTIDCYDNNMCIAGGSGGYVYRTFDGGTTWDTAKTVTDSAIYGLIFVNDSTIIGACHNPMGSVIISTDTGSTWQVDANSMTFFYPTLRSIVRSARDSFVTVGRTSNNPDEGFIVNWLSGSTHFETTDHTMNGVAMRDDSIAFAVGDSGLIVSNRETITSIEAVAAAAGIAIYPNPSSGSFTTCAEEPHSIKVYDLTGRLIYEDGAQSRYHSITVRVASPGMYVVQATCSSGTQAVQKILIR